MSKFTLWFIFPALLPFPIIAFISYGLLFSPLTPKEPIQLQVQLGSGLNKVALDLQEAEIIRSALAVKLLARWNQQSDQIQAGNYQFSDPATPGEILTRLVTGDVEKVSLTIPEGLLCSKSLQERLKRGLGNRKGS